MPKGGTNKSTYLHDIGKIIASQRKEYALADVHGIGDLGEESIDDLIMAFDKPSIYVLRQSTLLRHLYEEYGPPPETKKPTIDDKVWVMGLIFKSEVLRDMLPDMLGKSRGGNRPSIDAASGRKKAGFPNLHQDFIDRERMVTIPDLWLRGSMKLKVNDSKGANAYKEHGRFNPNNLYCISLPWTEKEVTAIFNTVLVEYNAAMINWMKGTGGGSGAPENFSIWEQRDPVLFVNYSNQPARIYLLVVYMWDKEYKFLLVTQKAMVPAQAAINDDDLFGNIDDELGGDGGEGTEQ